MNDDNEINRQIEAYEKYVKKTVREFDISIRHLRDRIKLLRSTIMEVQEKKRQFIRDSGSDAWRPVDFSDFVDELH